MKFFVAALCALVASSALAGEAPREIDFSTVLMSPTGPFKECSKQDDSGKCTEYADLTLGRICVAAAAAPEKGTSVVDQTKHGKLAMKLIDAKELPLDAGEIQFLKERIATLGYNNIAVYQAVKLLDPAAADK